jgi:hypothetical protein
VAVNPNPKMTAPIASGPSGLFSGQQVNVVLGAGESYGLVIKYPLKEKC